ncbi:S-adenosyl-L-methionine-dependent methyltransferase [Gloeophyllum trabeum ATCC 11539]|uniref:S-adenosyl-L-methionine-dependent methyltransferase n=1 Tax=Gloeophyllum trabeum (strain ATCC 11539 / FP-39264 / Madison 617) TaxID=670483 RepID=S7PWU5_GLOTA|nr:S-adenosyl-L-methionine-dependent methyltransferase [Gloeophyllum trabeum ATCC 11539]EPQ51857.1 S-adenosyl-L-methionine-dependent methyltransferase [Gloeophyllum trabeum ATCC 11539]
MTDTDSGVLRRSQKRSATSRLRCICTTTTTTTITTTHVEQKEREEMISHETLYGLANSLGACAMLTVLAYHFLAVNAKYVGQKQGASAAARQAVPGAWPLSLCAAFVMGRAHDSLSHGRPRPRPRAHVDTLLLLLLVTRIVIVFCRRCPEPITSHPRLLALAGGAERAAMVCHAAASKPPRRFFVGIFVSLYSCENEKATKVTAPLLPACGLLIAHLIAERRESSKVIGPLLAALFSSSKMASASEIASLLGTLTSAIDVFRAELVQQGLPEPSLLMSEPHAIDDASYVPPPAMYEARRLAIASLNSLKLLLENPVEAAVNTIRESAEIQGVRLAAEIGLPELLAGGGGASVAEVARRTGMHPLKLEGVLRLLAHRGWVREVAPGQFVNTRRSQTLRRDTPGYCAVRYIYDLMYRFMGKLPEALTHPDESFRMATDVAHTAWNLAYDTDLPFFGPASWTAKYPEDAEKFALGMGGLGACSDNGVVNDFPWVEFAKDRDAVVDIGGGQGTLACSLAAAHPEITSFVVQDIPAVRQSAEKYISSKGLSDRVKFESQDFFEPNRRQGTGSYVFILQKVLHDWNSEDGAKILRQIRECLLDGKSTLLIIDPLLSPATISSEGPSARVSLAALHAESKYRPVPPPPYIPSGFGDNWMEAYTTNVVLIALCNAFEHSYSSLEDMLSRAGMKIRKVNAIRSFVQITEVEVS